MTEWAECKHSLHWVHVGDELTDKDRCRKIGQSMLAMGARCDSKLGVEYMVDDELQDASSTLACLRELLARDLVVQTPCAQEGMSSWTLSSRGISKLQICVEVAKPNTILAPSPDLPLTSLSAYCLMDRLIIDEWVFATATKSELRNVLPHVANGPKILYKDRARKTLGNPYMLALLDSVDIFKDNPDLAIKHGQNDKYYKTIFEKRREPIARERLCIGYYEEDGEAPLLLQDKPRKRQMPHGDRARRGGVRGAKAAKVAHLALEAPPIVEGRADDDDHDDDDDSDEQAVLYGPTPPRSPDVGVSTPPASPPPLPPPIWPPPPDVPIEAAPSGFGHRSESEGGADGRQAKSKRKAGEWEDFFGNRLTKVKKAGSWIGWQIICMRHSNPDQLTDRTKCNRAVTFRVKGLAVDSPEFNAQNILALNELKFWACLGEAYPSRQLHMNEWAPPPGTVYPIPDVELDTIAFLNYTDVIAQRAEAADRVDDVACDVASSSSSSSSSAESESSEDQSESD